MVLSKEMLGNRLKEAREAKSKVLGIKYTQKMLADDVEVSRSYIGDIEVGRSYPSFVLLTKIAAACDVPLSFFGDIERDLDTWDHESLEENGEANSDLLTIKVVNPSYVTRPGSSYTRIPLLGTIRAGVPLLSEENFEEEVDVPSNIQADFALKVIGDSMSWAGIHEGDIAILRKINIPYNGMIVAAGIEDATWEATLKFYTMEKGVPILRAANPHYEDIEIGPDHKIIGHVVLIQKQPPTLKNYRDVLLVKEVQDETWLEAIENATQKGLDGEKAKRLFELFAHMVKQV